MGLLRGDESQEVVALHAQLDAGILELWMNDDGEVVLISNPVAIEAALRELEATGTLHPKTDDEKAM